MIDSNNVRDSIGFNRISRAFLHQLIAALTCNLAVVAVGPCFTWLEPLTQWLTSEESPIPMNSDDVSWLTSIIEVGELLVVIPSGILADRWGRKPVILSIGPMSVISWIMIAVSRDIVTLYIVRVLQGIALGIAFTVVPMYVAEISSPSVRGSLGGQFTVLWFVGILFSYCTGHYMKFDSYIYVQVIIPLIFFFTFIFMPESPYYYFMKENVEKGKSALKWFRYGQDISDEAVNIQKAVEDDMRHAGSWRDLIATKSDRRALFIVQIVCFVRYLTGMPAYLSFASQTFASSSHGSLTSDQLTIIMGAILMGSAFFSSLFSDSIGRRPLMIASSIGIFIFNTLLAVYYYLDQYSLVDLSSFAWIMYLSVAGFCVSINLGIGQLMQTVQAEFFPSNTRGLGGGVTGVTMAIATFINLILYQNLTDAFGVYMNFVSFSIFSFIGTIFIMKYVTESAGKSLAEINSNIKEITSSEK
ncbi:hypothetical protein O3M35_002958 [Rhynocoris fuscipes]|uniref:Major facilitator superfamily (MFS) profile domain-containing protein n=1 Tax=Rhynocoris fuscipes TaxID=488301 RepID=A0AAW1CJM6_9HEMI